MLDFDLVGLFVQYCDPGLISEVIVPLLSMQQSCLLCISTLLESGNHYSKMFELKDSIGRYIGQVNYRKDLALTVCLFVSMQQTSF